jgi:ubiquinone/menaquinone biosynthesis C-methylase UbiE
VTMATEWDVRAEAYRTSATHAHGADLDLVAEWCAPREGVDVLDVATGGGHVARRLREAGARVTTCDSSPGMRPDVICIAEELPFADGSFDVAVSRLAAHHFADVRAAVAELARVSRDRVVVEDLLFQDERCEEAEALRDPTHVRNLAEAEWRALFHEAGLEVEAVEVLPKRHELDEWLARTGCEGEEAERVRELLAHRTVDGVWTNEVVVLRGRK